jgi:hypothetical protein
LAFHRVLFGPDLVMLGPDEQFTLISISGDIPKKPNQIKCLCLLLGPDFFTDIIQIETADHARLSLKLSYNWHFDTKDLTEKDSSKLFMVPDFVGGKFRIKYYFAKDCGLDFQVLYFQTHARRSHQGSEVLWLPFHSTISTR